jgi:very-short-patch-repair endonuclease
VVVHRSRTLTPKDIRHRHGLPVTSPARTLLDLADILTARPLERALDEALVKHLVRRTQLQDVLTRAHGRHGARTLEALLDPKRPTTRTNSDPEEQFLALVRQARLPEPETNAPFLDFDVDVLWRAQRLAVEIDSYDYHSTRRKFQRDRAKRAAIVRAGYTLLRPTPEQIEDDGLAPIATIAETLARGA